MSLIILGLTAMCSACPPAYHWMHIPFPEYHDTIHVRIHYYGDLVGGEDDVVFAPTSTVRLNLFHPGAYCDTAFEQDIMNSLGYGNGTISAIVYPTSGSFDVAREALALRRVLDTLRVNLPLTMAPFFGLRISSADLIGYSEGCSAATLCAAGYSQRGDDFVHRLCCLAPTILNSNVLDAARIVSIPALIIGGDHDCVAPTGKHARPLYESLGSPKKIMVTLRGGDHCRLLRNNCTDADTSCGADLRAEVQKSVCSSACFSFCNDDTRFIWQLQNQDSAFATVRTTMTVHRGSYIVASKTTACVGDSVVLKTDPPDVYLWLPDSVYASERRIEARETTTYRIVDDNFGKVQSLIQINVGTARPLWFSGTTAMCDNDIITLKAFPQAQMGPCEWSTGARGDSVRINQPGIIQVRSFDSLSCSWSEKSFDIRSHHFKLSVETIAPLDGCHRDSTITLNVPFSYDSHINQIEFYDDDTVCSRALAPGNHRVWARVTRIADGCTMTSDTVHVFVAVRQDVEQPTITRSGNTLTCSPADAYVWAHEYRPIAGATNATYNVVEPGRYMVYTYTKGLYCHFFADYDVQKLQLSNVEDEPQLPTAWCLFGNSRRLQFNNVEPVNEIRMYSTLGELVLSRQQLLTGESIECEGLRPGWYVIQYHIKGHIHQRLLVIY